VSAYAQVMQRMTGGVSRLAAVAVGVIASVATLSSQRSAAGAAKITFRSVPGADVSEFGGVASRDGTRFLSGDGRLLTDLDTGTSVSIPVGPDYFVQALDRTGARALLVDANGRAIVHSVATGANVAVPLPSDSGNPNNRIRAQVVDQQHGPAAVMSGDGSVVAYTYEHLTESGGLTGGVFVTTLSGSPLDISPNAPKHGENSAGSPAISADGRYVVFEWPKKINGCRPKILTASLPFIASIVRRETRQGST
jgi:hypothetical protein